MTSVAAISRARKSAFDVLLALERRRAHAHSDDLLRSRAIDALSPADRHLVTNLVLGVLRWQILLDEQLGNLIKKREAKLDPEVSVALRMGAFQLRFLDRIPARAAIDESVELTKQSGHRYASGLVNAVLRKFAAARSADNEPGRTVSAIARAYAHPAWLVERWTRFYGLETARALCQHGQTQPARIVRLTDLSVEKELIESGITLEPATILTAARSAGSGDVAATAAFRERRIRIQDEGSQVIAELAVSSGNTLNQSPKNILDACAAPGGKALIFAERNPQARVLACESNPHRLAELSLRLAAYASRVECRLADATALNEESAFDLALADVPCSGTGTLGRNPEIRHRLQAEDLPRQAERQRAILSATLRAVRPGGRVLYSTCSLEPEENEQVVSSALAKNQNGRLVSLESQIAALAKDGILTTNGAARLRDCLTPDGALRILPGALPTDGFFVALIEKTA